MKAQEILATLKQLGKPQTAAIYKRHLSGDNVCGVLTSEIAKLQKEIKVDHALALWKTGNAEARVLALQVADPKKLTRAGRPGQGWAGPLPRLLFVRAPGPQPDRRGDNARLDDFQ